MDFSEYSDAIPHQPEPVFLKVSMTWEKSMVCPTPNRYAISVINFFQTYQNPRRETQLKHKYNL